jgi:hypothetical protein
VPTFTVTATQTGSGSTANGMAIVLKVITGQAAAPIGITQTATNTTPSLSTGTGVSTGSWVYGANLGDAGTYTVNGSTTYSQNTTGAGLEYVSMRSTSTMTGGSAVTLGGTAGVNSISICLLEILAAGTLAEDASSPAPVAYSAVTTKTTAAFTPPPGSLLVLMAATNGTASHVVGLSVTDTSGLGLTWTQQVVAHNSGSGYSGIWTAQIPNNPALAPVPVPPGMSSPAAFLWSHRPAQQAPVIIAGSALTGTAAASAVMTGERVVSDQVTGTAGVSGSFSGVSPGPALIYYPRLPGPVVRPISYASPSFQAPLAGFAAASGTMTGARTADGTLAAPAAASGVLEGLRQPAAGFAGYITASAAVSGFELGAGPSIAAVAAASGTFASARTAHGTLAGYAAAALLSAPHSSRHGLLTGYQAASAAAAGVVTTPAVAVVKKGSWWGLYNVLHERAEYADYYRSQPPVACPACGTPLRDGPPQEAAILYCPFDGWTYPRDWDPTIHSGM